MAHLVKCKICGIQFDRDKISCVQIGKRYAHIECAEKQESEKTQEQKDLEALESYILQLLKIDFIDARIRRSINDYHTKNNYSYSGILRSLIYHYEVKGNSVSKANGGIGIVPFVYRDAYNYYYNLFLAQQQNTGKNIESYIPDEIEIKIFSPKRKQITRPRFSFLDEED